jgi:hypothetical protein
MGGRGGRGLVPVVVGGGGSSSAVKFATPIAEISTMVRRMDPVSFFIFAPELLILFLIIH